MAAAEIDKNAHYGRYQKEEDARHKLAMKMRYKSLDIPEDDMGDIKADKTITNGLGFKEIVALGALGLGGAYMLGDRQPTAPPSPPAATAAADVTQKFDVLHYDQDGKLIDIQRLPAELKK